MYAVVIRENNNNERNHHLHISQKIHKLLRSALNRQNLILAINMWASLYCQYNKMIVMRAKAA